MIKAVVTAENKPAYPLMSSHKNRGGCENNTHKDQRCVQVFIVFLDEVKVVRVGYTLEFIVEFGAGIVSLSGGARGGWQLFGRGLPWRALNGRREKSG